MRNNLNLNKAGVSLIAVLLFMLVATIAATATWKWLSHEGFSSTSRMLKKQAYQNSIAGVENARAWMTFHANDVGALIKQYIDGNEMPVNLDAQLRPLQRPNQKHHVWLTGVNTSGSTYKLKILSVGESRNKSRHTEVAIFNVDGLYRVALPNGKSKKKVPFDYAYFGGTYDGAGDLTISSALINGNWRGNPQGIDQTFVVTGNADLSGNNVHLGNLACVGGNLNPENNGVSGRDLFVGKNMVGNVDSLTGDAYFNGDVSPTNAGKFVVVGNVTLNGLLKTVQNEKDLTIRGNLCLAEDAGIHSVGTNYTLETQGDVWMPGTKNIWYGTVKYSGCKCERVWCSYMGWCAPKTTVPCTEAGKKNERYGMWDGTATYTLKTCADTTLIDGGDNFDYYDKIILGGTDKNVYIKTGHPYSDYKYHQEVTTNFQETADGIIRCNAKPGVTAPAGHEYCDYDVKTGLVGRNERWHGNKHSPYPARDDKDKPNLYYSFYLPPGHTDVSYGPYEDTFWIWCEEWAKNSFGTTYCAKRKNGGVIYASYFVDGERYWDGYDPESQHPRKRLNYSDGHATGSPYCTSQPGSPGHEQDKYRPTCNVTPWFKSNGNVTNSEPSTKTKCAEDVVTKCDAIWEKKPGCDGSSYMVDDVLVTAKDKFESYAQKGCAKDIKYYDTDLVKKLNACYQENKNDPVKKENNLYNGYLVVNVSGGSTSTNPTGTLEGKFIIIAEDPLYTSLPPTADGTYVLLYLKKGASSLHDTKADEVKNYFIYTEGEIGAGNQFNMVGSLYATAESCAGLGKLQSSSLTYSPELVEELSNAGVICENDGSVCGGSVSLSSSSTAESSASGEGDFEDGRDMYYISMAPQLGVSLESQYENDETKYNKYTHEIVPWELENVQKPDTISPSYIILPRVIYLPSDPYGTLQDYYNVVPLNGAALKKTDVNVGYCTGTIGSIPTSGPLFEGTTLTKGIYKCEAKASGFDDIPFWVVVGNNHRGAEPIVFETPSQDVTAGGSKEVRVKIPPTTPSIQLRVRCPEAPENWTITEGETFDSKESNVCLFNVQGDASSDIMVTLFTVSPQNSATHGSITYQLLESESYVIGSPFTSTVKMATSATLNREEVTSEDITAYCQNHESSCPPEDERSTWPNCTTSETWVEPSGISFAPVVKNQSWSIVVGGTGTMKLAGKNIANCVTIIPTDDNSYDISELESNTSYSLRASLKAKKHTIKVAFVGEGITNDPVIAIDVAGKTSSCEYSSFNEDDEKACYVSAFAGEQVSLSVNRGSYNNFSYWNCSGESCPVEESISSENYEPFTVKDDNTVVYAHFNEKDKHCFFDEFNSGSVACSSTESEYCIDDCGAQSPSSETVCSSIDGAAGSSKWALINGTLNDIILYSGNIYVDKNSSDKGKKPVVVLSTVNAGIYGTLKALMQLPRETSSYPHTAANIQNSGFLLHTNNKATEFLMLNLYVNVSGKLEAQVCSKHNSKLDCKTAEPTNSYKNPAYVSTSNMVMMTATLSTDSKLRVSAFTGNYYSSLATATEEYVHEFDLNEFTYKYADEAHEFVGFSLADPNMKLYGIGWASESYSSECHDTYPTIKCSFAAKAIDGYIKTDTLVEPWIGHSAWFDSKEYNCSKTYYYQNGSDACGASDNSIATCNGNYKFADAGAGPHGYVNANEKDIKTARAWIDCHLPQQENAWTTATPENSAHCGAFWTGKFDECVEDANLLSEDLELGSNLESTVTFDPPVNLRATTLNILLENNYNNEIEIWLESKHDGDFETNWIDFKGFIKSQSALMKTNVGGFDVNAEMTAGADGFDPEKVGKLVFKNLGTATNVVVKQVVANCKNTVGVSECKATYKNDDGQWEILAEIVNKDKVTAYAVNAVVEEGTGWSIPSTSATPTWEGDGNRAKFTKADNPYAGNQGKSYKVSVSVRNKAGTETATACSVSPDPISSIYASCSVSPAKKKQGEGLPQFSFTHSGCPDAGCDYDIYLNSTQKLNDCSSVNDCSGNSKNVTVNKTPAGNTETDNYPAGTYTYTVRSPEGSSAPFPECSATFEIEEKTVTNDDVRTECAFDAAVSQPGAQATFRYSVNEKGINICNRAFELRDDDNKVVGDGNTGCGNNQGVSIRGKNTAKSKSFTLYVKDNDGAFQRSCESSLTVGSPNVTCTSITEGGVDKLKITVGTTCTEGACPYTVLKTYNGNVKTISSGTDLSSSEYKIPFEGVGLYSVAIDGVSVSGCSVSNGPKVTCPTTKRNFTVNQQASLTMSALSNCGDGCDYALVPGSGSGTHFADEENGDYKAASDAITFTPTLENDNVPYTFYVYAHEDHDLAANCSGTMAFVKGSTCKQVDWNMTGDNSNSASPSPNYPWKSNCATITTNRVCLGQVEIKAPVACENKTGTWNGVSFQLQGNGPPTKNFSTNPAPNTTNNLVINDCDEISSVYMTGCSEVGVLQDNKMTEVNKLYMIPAGTCVSLNMNWNNGYWIPDNGVKLRCSGDHSINETVTVDSRCLDDHVHCEISYSGDICAVSNVLYCSVSQ